MEVWSRKVTIGACLGGEEREEDTGSRYSRFEILDSRFLRFSHSLLGASLITHHSSLLPRPSDSKLIRAWTGRKGIHFGSTISSSPLFLPRISSWCLHHRPFLFLFYFGKDLRPSTSSSHSGPSLSYNKQPQIPIPLSTIWKYLFFQVISYSSFTLLQLETLDPSTSISLLSTDSLQYSTINLL